MNALSRWTTTLPQFCLFATAAALLATAELSSTRFEQLMQEDGWAEWATFCVFLFAGFIALRAVWNRFAPRERSLARVALLGLGLFCIFVAGEEISWGQRLLGFEPAPLFLEHNFQQESNFHNLLKGIFDTRWMVFAICVSYGVIAPYFARIVRLPAALAPAGSLLPWFSLIAFLEFSYPYELVGELAELLLGLVFLIDVSARTTALEQSPRAALRCGGLQLAALVAALGIVPLNDFALSKQSEELVAHTRAELNTLSERIARGSVVAPKLFHKREVHKRLYTAVQAGYLELERGSFYLDAWNSPYWVSFERKGEQRGILRLYSFGPNRRRDHEPHGKTKSASDDVLVSIDIDRPARAAR
jgi:hypothetical protein